MMAMKITQCNKKIAKISTRIDAGHGLMRHDGLLQILSTEGVNEFDKNDSLTHLSIN